MKIKKTVGGYRLIFGYLGIFLILIGIICLLPLFGIINNSSEFVYAKNFYIPGCSSIIIGALLFLLIVNKQKAQLGKHQDSILLVLVWVAAVLICALPFTMSKIQLGDMGMTFTESVFESASGFGTIGLTRFPIGMYSLKCYVLFRSFIAFFGGIGLVLVVTSAISDRYGLKLYLAEGHNDKLMPNLAKSARLILGIYTFYILFGMVAYIIAGMDAFDALNHSISAVATCGFSSKPGGIVEIVEPLPLGNQLAIEIISCVLMILGATNFVIHMALITGKFKKIWRDCEFRLFASMVLIFIPLFFACTIQAGRNDPALAIRYSSFTFISAVTTTGFNNIPNVTSVSQGMLLLVVLVNIIGGGMGSTAGGTKQYRVAIALKSIFWSLRNRLSSKKCIYPCYVWRVGERKEVTKDETIESFSYIFIYVCVLFFGAMVITILSPGIDIDYGEALFEFSNALSSTGYTCGVTDLANTGILWTLIAGMFVGRLEIYAVYLAFFRIGRDIFRKETV